MDEDGHEQDIKAIMDSCAGYGCQVADLASYDTPFFTRMDTPPPPSEETAEVSDDDQTISDLNISERYQAEADVSSEPTDPTSPPGS